MSESSIKKKVDAEAMIRKLRNTMEQQEENHLPEVKHCREMHNEMWSFYANYPYASEDDFLDYIKVSINKLKAKHKIKEEVFFCTYSAWTGGLPSCTKCPLEWPEIKPFENFMWPRTCLTSFPYLYKSMVNRLNNRDFSPNESQIVQLEQFCSTLARYCKNVPLKCSNEEGEQQTKEGEEK